MSKKIKIQMSQSKWKCLIVGKRYRFNELIKLRFDFGGCGTCARKCFK